MPYEIRRVREDDFPSRFDCLTTAFLDRIDIATITQQLVPHWDLTRVWGAFDGPVVGTLHDPLLGRR